MPNYTATTTISTERGLLSASKSGAYNEVINITQVVDNSTGFVAIASGSSTKGKATLADCKSLIIKNSGISGAEIQIKTYTTTNGTPDTTGSVAYFNYLLASGDYIYFPSMRQFDMSGNTSGGDAYTLSNQAPHSDMYVALNNAAAGDAQLLNGTELASGTTATSVTVDEGAYLYAGDLIRLENEICEVVSIASDVLTIIRGTHGSTAATHADDVAIRMPFFNAYENFTAATGGYDTVQTNDRGMFKSTNFFGYARNTDGSGNRESNGIVAGSFSGKFYSSGYQELGLADVTSHKNTGLTASTEYEFDIQVDGGSNFDNLSFTTDSSDLSFGKTIQLIQAALDTQYYTSGNLFEKKVNVGIVNGDVRFTSASNLSTSAIALTAGSSGTAEFFGTGRIPTVAKLGGAVASALPPDTIIDKKSGLEIPNVGGMFYDDGLGNIKGTCSGTISYDQGLLDIRSAPPNANFVVSANYGSGHSGGNKFSSNAANSIVTISGRSANSKFNTTIEIIGLN